MKKNIFLSWSSGKDSAWSLYVLQQSSEFEVTGLFTTINQKYSRAAMHSTRLEILKKQAEVAGLSLKIIELPDPCSNEEYELIMRRFIKESTAEKIEYMAFGDLFLNSIREYRERQFEGTGIKAVFPLWGIPTKELSEQMLSAGLEAYISCVDLKKLPISFAGKKWTRELIAELPEGCDLCGENGEFHTVVTNAPMFSKRIPVNIGDIVERKGFAFADIVTIN